MDSLNILDSNPLPDLADKILPHSVSFFFAHHLTCPPDATTERSVWIWLHSFTLGLGYRTLWLSMTFSVLPHTHFINTLKLSTLYTLFLMVNCRQLSVSATKLSAAVHECTRLLMQTHTHSDNICTLRFTELTDEVLQLSRNFILPPFPRCPVSLVSIPVLYFRYAHGNEVL